MNRPGRSAAILLLLVLVVQVSVLPDTLQLKPVGRVLNALILTAFIGAGVYAILQGRPFRAPLLFVVPSVLVLLGYTVNILRNLGPETLGYVGMLLPWLAVLSVPFMKSHDLDRAWFVFYRFMLVFSVIACLEYAAVFAGAMSPSVIETDRGPYMRGIFTIFHGLEDGTPYYRMYGVFMEPGTFAMLLMPAIAYCLVNGRYPAMALFFLCLLLTTSLGGFASLLVLAGVYIFWRARKPAHRILALSGFVGVTFVFFVGQLVTAYQEKQGSATVREDNVTLFLDNFWLLARDYPFGLPLMGKSFSALAGTDVAYFGSNFALATAFMTGGFVAFLGYTAMFLMSLLIAVKYFMGSFPNRAVAPALLSLPPLLLFVFQRQTIFDLALFAFLFATPMMLVLRNHPVLFDGGAAPDDRPVAGDEAPAT